MKVTTLDKVRDSLRVCSIASPSTRRPPRKARLAIERMVAIGA